MNFQEAFEAMKQGAKVKLPGRGGYWYWDQERDTIMIQCRSHEDNKPGELLDFRETKDFEYTLSHTFSDEWMIV